MARKIFTVGLELPGQEFDYVDFDSNQTLLDADICIFQPTLGSVRYDYSGFQGHSLIDQSSSIDFKRNCTHWRNEIVSAAGAGKLVVVLMIQPTELYYYTGRQEVSGTGRSQRTTNIVNPCSSYDSIPNLARVTAKNGTSVKLTKDANFLKPYWLEFSKYSAYQAEFEGKSTTPILMAGTSDRMVGAVVKTPAGGGILFLPPLGLSSFIKKKDDKSYWTSDGIKFGHRLSASVSAMAGSIAARSDRTPPPSWAASAEFRLTAEKQLLKIIEELDGKITDLSKDKEVYEEKLAEAGNLRFLLYEQGSPLEKAVLEVMKMFGFSAERFLDGESEFDVIFVSAEGRCLGEVEGKENKAVNIEKFSQLERNIQEDFAREDVADYAKAVLFGNAYRLKPLAEREAFFTTKCLSAAGRVGAALVRTPDLFEPAKYLQAMPENSSYAKACREAILLTKGGVVVFPPVPTIKPNN